jgi:copper resistance protein B
MKRAHFDSNELKRTAPLQRATVLIGVLALAHVIICVAFRNARAQSSGPPALMKLQPYAQPGSSVITGAEPMPVAESTRLAGPYNAEFPLVHDNMIFWHVLFDQLEGRSNGPDNELRWDGQSWVGSDWDKLWFKSEGFFNRHGRRGHGRLEDGIHEVLYDRPIPFLRYFDWQAGFRYDGDSGPPRYWAALGVQGLAPEFLDLEMTLYLRNGGHLAARVVGAYDILLTNRLIAQPEVEMNFYSKGDPGRAIGRGLSELDTGLRLRYEVSRKFGPYILKLYRLTYVAMRPAAI